MRSSNGKTGKKSDVAKEKPEVNMAKLRNATDEEIIAGIPEDPDTFLPDASFWENTKVVQPPKKVQITLKLDAKVLDYFKKGGRGVNTRINAVLQSYVDAQK